MQDLLRSKTMTNKRVNVPQSTQHKHSHTHFPGFQCVQMPKLTFDSMFHIHLSQVELSRINHCSFAAAADAARLFGFSLSVDAVPKYICGPSVHNIFGIYLYLYLFIQMERSLSLYFI